jgi:hypothetical protein
MMSREQRSTATLQDRVFSSYNGLCASARDMDEQAVYNGIDFAISLLFLRTSTPDWFPSCFMHNPDIGSTPKVIHVLKKKTHKKRKSG